MNATWSLVLNVLSSLLGAVVGDPAHRQLGAAVQKVLQVGAAVVDGADINPAPVHAVLQDIAATGRAPTPDDWQKLHDVAHASLTGEADTAPAAPAATPPRRQTIQPKS